MNVVVSGIEALLGLPEEEFNSDSVEQLERYIYECQTYLRNEGEPLVEDAIYDRLIDILESVKPESDIFNTLWDEEPTQGTATVDDDYDKFKRSNPLLSIQTVKSWENNQHLDAFLSRLNDLGVHELELFYAYKLNGWGVRVVYRDGKLVKAGSRARVSQGNDITRQMRNVLGDFNPHLKGYGLVEIRGEICVRLSDFPKVKELNPSLKSPFSAVASLAKPSSTKEENSLLTFQGYRAFSQGLDFASRSDEYAFLEQCGFEVPKYITEVVDVSDPLQAIQEAFGSFEEEDEAGENDFFCDGIVLEVNDRQLADSLGIAGRNANYNVALKVGRWSQDSYVGYVQDIIWTPGKSKMSPVALVADEPNKAVFDELGNIVNMGDMGVVTAQGNRVSNVPLYEPKNILILDAYPGEMLHFRYGGEAGVVPQTPEGYLLTDAALRNRVDLSN